MNIGITNIASNVGLSFENLILLLVVLGSLIFYARDFKIGILMTFLTTTLCFMGMYQLNLNYTPSLVVVFMSLVIMSFSFYGTGRDSVAGGLV